MPLDLNQIAWDRLVFEPPLINIYLQKRQSALKHNLAPQIADQYLQDIWNLKFLQFVLQLNQLPKQYLSIWQQNLDTLDRQTLKIAEFQQQAHFHQQIDQLFQQSITQFPIDNDQLQQNGHTVIKYHLELTWLTSNLKNDLISQQLSLPILNQYSNQRLKQKLNQINTAYQKNLHRTDRFDNLRLPIQNLILIRHYQRYMLRHGLHMFQKYQIVPYSNRFLQTISTLLNPITTPKLS